MIKKQIKLVLFSKKSKKKYFKIKNLIKNILKL